MKLASYKQLIVWQKAMDLVEQIYTLTKLFPKEELYGIVMQMRRAAVSIPSNIAEGYARKSHKEYLQFFAISYGSALELETQIEITKRLGFAGIGLFKLSESLLQEVCKMLYTMVYKNQGTASRV